MRARPLSLMLCGLAALPALAQNPDRSEPARQYVCYRASAPLEIDGRLDEDAWKNAPWSRDFVDIEGSARPRPRFRTRMKLLWDAEYLYVGAELEEPHVWGTLTEHDSVIFKDNDFELFIDPDGDNHHYYEVEINALNAEWDLHLPKPYRDGGPAQNEWEIPGLKKAVQVDGTLNDPRDRDHGWTVELAIPWTALKTYARRTSPPGDGDQWRMNFSRVEWETEIADGAYRKVAGKKEANWVWSPQGVVDMHRPEKWGYVQFSKASAGPVRFFPDFTIPAREYLMRLYYAQRAFKERTGQYAGSLEELAFPAPRGLSLLHPLTLTRTPDGYEAWLELKTSPTAHLNVHVRQDSRLWEEFPPGGGVAGESQGNGRA